MGLSPAEIKEAFCESFNSEEIADGVCRISTPLLDWKGEPTVVYLTADGRITDGGGILNELTALGLDQAFQDWRFRGDYFAHHGIKERLGELECTVPTGAGVLAFVQGLSRVASHFEVKISPTSNDQFIGEVRAKLRPQLRARAGRPGAQNEARTDERLARRTVKIGPYTQRLDLSPADPAIWIQVIGRERSSESVKTEHIHAKFLPHFLGKEERSPHRFVVVLPTPAAYPAQSLKLIREKCDAVVAWRTDEKSAADLCDLLLLPANEVSLFT